MVTWCVLHLHDILLKEKPRGQKTDWQLQGWELRGREIEYKGAWVNFGRVLEMFFLWFLDRGGSTIAEVGENCRTVR